MEARSYPPAACSTTGTSTCRMEDCRPRQFAPHAGAGTPVVGPGRGARRRALPRAGATSPQYVRAPLLRPWRHPSDVRPVTAWRTVSGDGLVGGRGYRVRSSPVLLPSSFGGLVIILEQAHDTVCVMSGGCRPRRHHPPCLRRAMGPDSRRASARCSGRACRGIPAGGDCRGPCCVPLVSARCRPRQFSCRGVHHHAPAQRGSGRTESPGRAESWRRQDGTGSFRGTRRARSCGRICTRLRHGTEG